jgi:hypothetical protein
MYYTSRWQIGLRVTAIFIATTGSLIVGIALLKLHHAMAKSHFIDIRNFKPLLKRSEKMSIAGITLLSIAATLSLTAEFLVLADI